jgi:L-amino acid N-acyltransferase YncA
MSRASTQIIAIRPCEERDMAAVADIYCNHVRTGLASFELEPPDVAEMLRRRYHVLKNGLPYVVADTAGEIAGYAYATPYRLRPAYRYTVENSVYVRACRVGQGIGRLILVSLLEECERRGSRQVVAVIGDSANHASIGLHTSLGFRKGGVMHSVGFKFGRWGDSVLMQRDLGAGDRTDPFSKGM